MKGDEGRGATEDVGEALEEVCADDSIEEKTSVSVILDEYVEIELEVAVGIAWNVRVDVCVGEGSDVD